MNATDLTAPCALVQYGLIMLMCGSQKMEFRHDGKLIGRNAELRTVWFGSVIGKRKPNRPTVFRRPLKIGHIWVFNPKGVTINDPDEIWRGSMHRGSSDVSYLTLINDGGAGAPKLKI